MNVYAKPYRHGNVPAAMKETALKLIDEGYDVGLRECARRIGISATAAYRHFENLDALASSVAAIIVYDMVEAIDAEGQLAEERGDSAEQARAAAFVAWAEANHLRFRFAVQRADYPHEQFELLLGDLWITALGAAILVSLGTTTVSTAQESLQKLKRAA